MNTFIKALVALVPICMLFCGALLLFLKERTLYFFLQLLGAGCLIAVVVAHISEALHWFPAMHWGLEHSIGQSTDGTVSHWKYIMGNSFKSKTFTQIRHYQPAKNCAIPSGETLRVF